MKLALQPHIGIGTVWHQRLRPAGNAFAYRGYFVLLPMRTLRHTPCAALKRNQKAALLSFHDADHGEGGADALAWVEALLQREGVSDADGEIWLQTLPRVLGFAFKPVSFWYALRADGSPAAVVAEVNNTFGERHIYLLRHPAWGQTVWADKAFYVSPFCRVEGQYCFRFRITPAAAHRAAAVQARVDLYDADGALIQTSQSGRLQALTPASARHAFWSVPLMSWGVVWRIHWQALRLWLKRVPLVPKPAAPKDLA
ncbi:DUF1365 domain-containing protein [Roseateles sp. BYS180W]|uniref:DUF1365 domain-containing protein n=1 Tax=Roseateles rivi TaxID=3299028 RepID=A0ABW7FS12_9BURK